MAFQLSPNIVVREHDLSGIIPAVSATIAAIAGWFSWGPVDEPLTITNENYLYSKFGGPVGEEKDTSTTDQRILGNATVWLTAANFLMYGNNLRVIRVVNKETARNATNTGTGVYIGNSADYDTWSEIAGTTHVAAKYPGAIGDGILVSICDSSTWENIPLTGTITADPSSTEITGSETAFTTELYVGAEIDVGGEWLQVISIDNDETLTVLTEPETTYTGTSVNRKWKYHAFFDGAPNTSDHAASNGGNLDEVHVVVVDTLGKFSGIAGTILETYPFASKALDAKKENGGTNYYKQLLEGSNYVWMLQEICTNASGAHARPEEITHDFSDLLLADLFGQAYRVTLTGGKDGVMPTDGEILGQGMQGGYSVFTDPETSSDVNLIIAPPFHRTVNGVTVGQGLVALAENRRDAVTFLSPPAHALTGPGTSTDQEKDVLAFREALNLSSSYGVMDSSWKYMYDRYNDKYRWVPLCGDTAGLCARTDETNAPWWSPAGYNRGQIKGVVKLAFNPVKPQRDELYKKGINSVVNFAGEGTILYGDKTMLYKPSAFDRINIRRLFIVLQKAISTGSRYDMFEFNDHWTRLLFVQKVEPFLRGVQAARGIEDFYVKCDEVNNPPEVRARKEFVADIYIKPMHAINFIFLNFVATRSGVDFNEIIGMRF